MALNLDEAIKTAETSLDGALILKLISEVQMLRREGDLAKRDIVRLSTELAYTDTLAERLKTQNKELVEAVVAAQAEGLFDSGAV